MAEYQHLKKLEQELEAGKYKDTFAEMYQILLGLAYTRLSKDEQMLLTRSLRVQQVVWTFKPPHMDTATPATFTIESIPVEHARTKPQHT